MSSQITATDACKTMISTVHNRCKSIHLSHYLLSDPLAATLRISPDRSQFFWYDYISDLCSTRSSWIVKRNTSIKASKPCETGWGISTGSSCAIEDLYSADTEVYWCESQQGEHSNTVSITVTSNTRWSSSLCNTMDCFW